MTDVEKWPPRFTVAPMTPAEAAKFICDIGEVHEDKDGRVNWTLLGPAIQQFIEDAYTAGFKAGQSATIDIAH